MVRLVLFGFIALICFFRFVQSSSPVRESLAVTRFPLEAAITHMVFFLIKRASKTCTRRFRQVPTVSRTERYANAKDTIAALAKSRGTSARANANHCERRARKGARTDPTGPNNRAREGGTIRGKKRAPRHAFVAAKVGNFLALERKDVLHCRDGRTGGARHSRGEEKSGKKIAGKNSGGGIKVAFTRVVKVCGTGRLSCYVT